MSKAQDNVKKYVDKITKDDAVLKEIRRLKMTNIEEMEKIFDRFNRNMFCDAVADNIAIRDFMRMSLDSLKDLHEENCKIWKAIAELQVGDMQKFHDKIYENNLDNRKELNIDDKDNQKD
jgi:flagellar motor component MotA